MWERSCLPVACSFTNISVAFETQQIPFTLWHCQGCSVFNIVPWGSREFFIHKATDCSRHMAVHSGASLSFGERGFLAYYQQGPWCPAALAFIPIWISSLICLGSPWCRKESEQQTTILFVNGLSSEKRVSEKMHWNGRLLI